LRGPEFREVGACRCWPRCSRNRVSIPAGPQRRIPRILGAGAFPCRAFLGLPRNIKARLPETLGRTDLRSKSKVRISLIRRLLIGLVQDKTWRGARRAGVLYRPPTACHGPPQRSKGALMQTSFACGQGFAPTPHSPVPHWRPSGRAQAPAQPWPKRWPARWVHEQGPQPAARAPARGPALKAWGRKARRVAPCESRSSYRYPPCFGASTCFRCLRRRQREIHQSARDLDHLSPDQPPGFGDNQTTGMLLKASAGYRPTTPPPRIAQRANLGP